MYIQNVGYFDIEEGHHLFTKDDVLIQIVDKGMDFPKPKSPFKEIHQFKFSDVSKNYDPSWPNRITEKQAKDIINIIANAKKNRRNIIVHCFAGVCRSGAVTEAAIQLFGYEDLKEYRKPNPYVHLKLCEAMINQFEDDVNERILNELMAIKLRLKSKDIFY